MNTLHVAESTTAPKLDTVFDPQSAADFKACYNETSFQYRHNLAGHPLFELPRLATLAEYLLHHEGSSSVKWTSSSAKIDMRWSEMPRQDRKQKITEAIAGLEQSGSWLLLYRVQADPEYRALMERVISEVESMSGRALASMITWKDAYIFLASPHSITPFHIDHECTFLLQIHGQREANIWDQNDRTALSEREIEDYYAGNLSAARYSQEKQARAKVYDMVAGTGVHHPVLAPHAFKNGPTYSIALGVHFCLRDCDERARIYQMNSLLRRLRLRPTPPGRSTGKDSMKIRLLGALSKRKPASKYELLRSGFQRLTFPYWMISRLKKRTAG